MENKISLLDFTAQVAKKTGMKQSTVKAFLSSLGPQLSEAILAEGLVKMGGLGTFKLLQVEARKSVDVNTGEAIIINGYNKVSFIPEGGVKERINAPLAGLPTLLVGEDGVPVLPESQPTEIDPLARLGAQADEIMTLVADINGGSTPTEEVVAAPVENVAEESVETLETPDAPVETPIETPTETPAETPVVEPVEELVEAPIAEPEGPVAVPAGVTGQQEPDEPKKKEKKGTDLSWFKAAVMVVVLFVAIVGISVALLMKQLDKWMDNYQKEKKEMREERHKKDSLEQTGDVAVVESVTPVTPTAPVEESKTQEEEVAPVVTQPKETAAQPEPEPKAEVKTAAVEEKIDFKAPRDYKKFGTKFTVRLKAGETLAALSRKYFGAYYFWVYIYEANRDVYPNANDISEGAKLRIPKMPKGYVDAHSKEARDYAKSLEFEYK